jgi:hypothetical protein
MNFRMQITNATLFRGYHFVLNRITLPELSSLLFDLLKPAGYVIEVRKCVLPLGAEPFVFQFAIQKFKYQDI